MRLLLLLALITAPSAAHAYIGPGIGVVFVNALLGPIAAIISAVVLVLYFPIRYFYKKHRKKHETKQGTSRDTRTAKKPPADHDKNL